MASFLGGIWNIILSVITFPLTLVKTALGSSDDPESKNDVYPGNAILSSEEVTAIKRSWKLMAKDSTTIKNTGVEFFYLLFTMHPKTKKFFKQFENVPDEKLKEHNKMKGHAVTVMYSLQSYMDNLDDLETLVELVKKTATSHYPRGVRYTDFKLLTSVIHSLLDEVCGGNVSQLTKDSWEKLLGVVVDLVKETHEALKKEEE